jgi:hypothetical protein
MGCIQQNKQININPFSNNNILIKKAIVNKTNTNNKNKNNNNYNNNNNNKNLKNKNKNNKKNNSHISIIDKITNNKWLKILDYLNYNELKEVGKVNKLFNNFVKNKDILLKFFQKREKFYTKYSSNFESIPTLYTTNLINMRKNDLSFSILQQEDSLIVEDINNKYNNNFNDTIVKNKIIF